MLQRRLERAAPYSGFFYEQAEKIQHFAIFAIQHFRMPLYSEDELIGRAFQTLDDTIRGDGCDAQVWCRVLDGHMMERIHEGTVAKNLMQGRAWGDVDRMAYMIGRMDLVVLDVRIFLLRAVLVQCTAAGYIDELQTAADGENRELLLHGSLEQENIKGIALIADLSEQAVRLFAEKLGIHIVATGEDQGIQTLQLSLDHFFVGVHGQDDGDAACPEYGFNIILVDIGTGVAGEIAALVIEKIADDTDFFLHKITSRQIS